MNKKIKKIVFLSLLLFFFTGCTVNYEMEIYKNTIKENIEISEQDINVLNSKEKRDEVEDDITVMYDYWKETNNTNYKLTKDFSKEKLSLKIKGNQELEPLTSLVTANNCYKYFNILDSDESYVLSTSNENLCFGSNNNLDKINVKISTNHKVIQHNADDVENDTYIWKINEDNYKDKPIQIEFYKNKYVWNYNNQILKRLLLIILIIGGTVLVVFAGYKFYKKREGNVNF